MVKSEKNLLAFLVETLHKIKMVEQKMIRVLTLSIKLIDTKQSTNLTVIVTYKTNACTRL